MATQAPMRMLKDKNRPKGAMSAYACFVQVIREEHKKKHPSENVVFSEFTKKCAEKWKQMTAKEKKRFDDMAQLDKERFNREIHDYIPPDGFRKGKKRKRTKDPGMPKRAWSAFFFFCDEFRPRIREAHPEWKVSDVAKELGRRWEECVEKTQYERKAAADKQRYEEDMQKYKLGTYVPPKRSRTEELAANYGVGDITIGSVGDETMPGPSSEGDVDDDDEEGVPDCEEGEVDGDLETEEFAHANKGVIANNNSVKDVGEFRAGVQLIHNVLPDGDRVSGEPVQMNLKDHDGDEANEEGIGEDDTDDGAEDDEKESKENGNCAEIISPGVGHAENDRIKGNTNLQEEVTTVARE